MIEAKDITKMVRHIIRRDQGVTDTEIMHPMREWVTGIVVTMIVVAVGGWLSFMQYETYVEKRDTPVTVVESAVSYQAAKISAALEVYTEKRLVYDAALGNKNDIFPEVATSTPVIEPALPAIPETQVTVATSTPTSTLPDTPVATSTPTVTEPNVDLDVPIQVTQ